MNDIEVFDIRDRISESVIDFFDTMLSLEVALVDEEAQAEEAVGKVSGNIGFAGDVVGMLRFEVSNTFSQIMAAEMLGMEVEELEGEDEIKDVILETCNILAGNLKSAFNDHGLPCVISTPAITTGNDFDVEILNMARYERFLFRCNIMGEHYILIEVCVKSREDALPDVMKKLSDIDVSKFERLDIISTAGDTLIELFELMLSMKLEAWDSGTEMADKVDRVVATVNFAGDVLGAVSIIVEKNFARIITGKMIDRPLEEVQNEEEIKDVIGEICNIVSGNLKGGFSDSGLVCEVSLPSITSGQDFKIEILNMARYERFCFRFYDHHIFIEVCVKIDENVVVSDSVTDVPEAEVKAAPETRSVEPGPVSEELPGTVSPSDAGEGEAVPEIPATDSKPDVTAGKTVDTTDGKFPMNLDFILDIPIEVSVELGRTRMKLSEMRALEPGNSVVFDNIEDDKLEVFANNQLIAKGEVVVEKGKYGIRITEVVSRIERIRKLK